MERWTYTEEIKVEADRRRRRQDRVLVDEQLESFFEGDDVGNRCARCGPGLCDPEVHEVDVFAFLAGVSPEAWLARIQGEAETSE